MRGKTLRTNTKLSILAGVLVSAAIFVWIAIWFASAQQQTPPQQSSVETIPVPAEPTIIDNAAVQLSPRRTDGVLVDPTVANRQPIAVMIENPAFGGVRPQAGLAAAEVVYEVLVEGGITRFMGYIFR